MKKLIFFLAILICFITYLIYGPNPEISSIEEIVYLDNAYSGEQCSCIIPINNQFTFTSFRSGCECLKPEFQINDKWVTGNSMTEANCSDATAIKFLVAVSALPSQSAQHAITFYDANNVCLKKYVLNYTAKSRTFILSDYILDTGIIILNSKQIEFKVFVYDEISASRSVVKAYSDNKLISCRFTADVLNAPIRTGYIPIGALLISVKPNELITLYSNVFIIDNNGVESKLRVQGTVRNTMSITPDQSTLPRRSSTGLIYQSKHTVRHLHCGIRSLEITKLPYGINTKVSIMNNHEFAIIEIWIDTQSDYITKATAGTLEIVATAVLTDGTLAVLKMPLYIN